MDELLPIVMEVGEKTSSAWRFWIRQIPKAMARLYLLPFR